MSQRPSPRRSTLLRSRIVSGETQGSKAELTNLESIPKDLQEGNKECSGEVSSPNSPTKNTCSSLQNTESIKTVNCIENSNSSAPACYSTSSSSSTSPEPTKRRIAAFVRDEEGKIKLPSPYTSEPQDEHNEQDYVDRNTVCEPEGVEMLVWTGFGESEGLGGAGRDWVSSRLERRSGRRRE